MHNSFSGNICPSVRCLRMAALKRLRFLLLNFKNGMNRIHDILNIRIDKKMKVSPRIFFLSYEKTFQYFS